jgi:DNA repair protein RecN (Recombination protein N)
MLQKLTIQNYALIDNLEINLDKGLNILTGETGAGKSIILGALSLILGQRAESRYFFNQQKKCVIEGSFKIAGFLFLKRTTWITKEKRYCAGRYLPMVNQEPL